jgi:DNA-binding NarL/FixJ family response regulator
MPSEAHSKIRVLVVDDHQMFIQGIVAMFAEDEEIDIIDGCADGKAVLEQLQSVMADVVLLDINLPDMDGVDVCKKISALYPETKIIALTMYNEGSFITGMLKNGAKGYVLKNSDKNTLKEAIQTVYQGGSFFGEDVAQTLMQGMMPEKQRSRTKGPKLTRREKEILNLIVQEHTTHEIAEQLFISLNTVETHRKNLLQKLNVRNTAGLVRFAVENGLVD